METYESFAIFSASGLRPEPVKVNTKVIVVGSAFLYHLLYNWDDEFHEMFKVRADFNPVMERDQKHQLAYAQWVGILCNEEGLPHFDRSGIERLIEYGARQAGDRDKVSASCAEVADLVREAVFCARKEDRQLASARHVEQALQSRGFRSNRIEEQISRLANVPLRQDIAVTGSVNQWGEVQAIGGVNEKIEGFYDICRISGLTGKPGVLIPESNVRHLVLRGDVIQAVAEGKFHIYPVRTIDDGLAILTSMPANGGANERDVNHAVSERLKELALGLKEFAGLGRNGADGSKP